MPRPAHVTSAFRSLVETHDLILVLFTLARLLVQIWEANPVNKTNDLRHGVDRYNNRFNAIAGVAFGHALVTTLHPTPYT